MLMLRCWWFNLFEKFRSNSDLDGGFKYFLFSSLFGEDSHFDYIIFFRWVETTNQWYICDFHPKQPGVFGCFLKPIHAVVVMSPGVLKLSQRSSGLQGWSRLMRLKHTMNWTRGPAFFRECKSQNMITNSGSRDFCSRVFEAIETKLLLVTK